MALFTSLPSPKATLQLILKLTGNACNLNCAYCYEQHRVHKENALLHPQTIRRCLDALGQRPLSVQLHGGEPLLVGREHMRLILAEVRRYPNSIELLMQTNGTLLDDKWLDFFLTEWPDIFIGISHDGDSKASLYRRDHQGLPVDARVEKALRACEARQIKIGVISVIHRQVCGRADELLDYSCGFPCIRLLNLMPCFHLNPTYRKEEPCQASMEGETTPETAPWALSPTEYYGPSSTVGA